MEKPLDGEEFVAVTLPPDIVPIDGVVVEELGPDRILGVELATVEFASPGRPVVLLTAADFVIAAKGASVEEHQVGGFLPTSRCCLARN
jgi:hypothetical protein